VNSDTAVTMRLKGHILFQTKRKILL